MWVSFMGIETNTNNANLPNAQLNRQPNLGDQDEDKVNQDDKVNQNDQVKFEFENKKC